MIGDTITITHNAVSRVLTRLDPGLPYAADYMLRTATDEFRIRVRHTVENAPKGSVPFDRHQVELSVTTFATATQPEIVQIASYLIRTRKGTDPAAALLASKAMTTWLTDANVTKLIAWES